VISGRPRLKDFAWVTLSDSLILTREPGLETIFERADPALLDVLSELDGTKDWSDIAATIAARHQGLEVHDVARALEVLDGAGLLEDAKSKGNLTPDQTERYATNLEFFGGFATMQKSRYAFQKRLVDSRVLLLGAGGIGSAVLASLVGLGIGSIVLVDGDDVEPKNLARQFVYALDDVGHPKALRAADRMRAMNDEVTIDPRVGFVRASTDVATLLQGVDLVISTVDEPVSVHAWVNDACVSAHVPFIMGGIWGRRAQYTSVKPGVSGCLNCLSIIQEREPGVVVRTPSGINQAIGPTAQIVGGLIAAEALRYLTAFCNPLSPGRLWVWDAVTGQIEAAGDWSKLDECSVCFGTIPEEMRNAMVGSATPSPGRRGV
jgi:molybdopterin/thiamine biosynthesis adenylyltransferase